MWKPETDFLKSLAFLLLDGFKSMSSPKQSLWALSGTLVEERKISYLEYVQRHLHGFRDSVSTSETDK